MMIRARLLALTGMLLGVAAGPAYGDILFSGSGASGTLSSPSETWHFNFDGGAAATGFLNNWGSPGVGAGIVPYGETQTAFGMTLTFTGGGTINAASITTGNGAGCAGSTTGGTTFCTISPTDIWEAFQTGPSSIEFLAQNSSFFLSQGQNYFVNIFFDGATPTAFTGAFLTSFTPSPTPTPEPSTFALLGMGLAGFVVRRVRSRKHLAR
jgi:PEP-CTERM motif